jgi:hypothetical protein
MAILSTSGTVTNGSNQVTSIASMTSIAIGQAITGVGIAAGTTVTAVNTGASSLTMSANATGGTVGEGIDFMTWVAFVTQYHINPARKILSRLGLRPAVGQEPRHIGCTCV